MEKTYNTEMAAKAQKEYCNEKGYPHFAPYDGICFRCNKNIYKPIEHERRDGRTGKVIGTYTTGISVEVAGTVLITGCPHCNHSYCD